MKRVPNPPIGLPGALSQSSQGLLGFRHRPCYNRPLPEDGKVRAELRLRLNQRNRADHSRGLGARQRTGAGCCAAAGGTVVVGGATSMVSGLVRDFKLWRQEKQGDEEVGG